MMMRYNIVVNGEFGNWYPSSRKRGKMWIHQMAETGTNTPLYQSSKTRAGAKNVKKCGLLGGCPNMAGWSKETWVKRFGLDPLHVALRLDQHNFIPILLLIIIFIFVVHLFTSRYLSHWSHLKAFSPLLWSLDMWPIPSNNDLKSLLTAKCPEPVQITDARVRRTWRPLSSLISTPLKSSGN